MWCHSFHLLRHDLESPHAAETELPPVALLKGEATVVIERQGLFPSFFCPLLLLFDPFSYLLPSSMLVVVLCFVVCSLFFCVVLRLLTVSRSLASHYCIVNVFRSLVVVVLSTHPYFMASTNDESDEDLVWRRRQSRGRETEIRNRQRNRQNTYQQNFASKLRLIRAYVKNLGNKYV